MRLPRLAAFLARHIVPRRKPDFLIGGSEDPYMARWWLIPRNSVLNVYLHSVIRSDDDRALHDHPYVSVSLMLAGRLGEVYRPDHRKPETKRRLIRAGRVVWRGARFAHRLVVLPKAPMGALTLFITGPRVREWGFICPGGWKHWRDFVALSETGDSARIGKGCDD